MFAARFFKQLILDSIYALYIFCCRKNVPSPQNNSIAIIFLGRSTSNKIIIPLGEFIIREPLFRYLKEQGNTLTLVTQEKKFMKIRPFNQYFKKIISLKAYLASSDSYDYVILAQNNMNLPLPHIKSKAQYLISYAHQDLYRHVSWWKDIDFFPRYYLGARHELQRAFDVIKIKVNPSHPKNFPSIPSSDTQKNKVTFTIMDESNFKSLSNSHIISLLKEILSKNPSSKIYLVGDATAVKSADHIIKAVKNKRVINKAGKTNINELIKILAQSKLVISPDTGTAHLAAALHKRLVVYYKKTVLDRWKPLGEKVSQYDLNTTHSFSSFRQEILASV